MSDARDRLAKAVAADLEGKDLVALGQRRFSPSSRGDASSHHELSEGDREAAWQAYRTKMLALDAVNNLAGRGLIPSHRDWHAGWDAAVAARPALLTTDTTKED